MNSAKKVVISDAAKQQVCVRIKNPAYKAINVISGQWKQHVRGVTSSEIMNICIVENWQKYINLSADEVREKDEFYQKM